MSVIEKPERITTSDLKNLNQRSMSIWCFDALRDWGVILSAIALAAWAWNPIVFLVAALVVGNRQHALSLLGHDGTHYTLTHRKRLNDLITNFASFWPLGITVSGYRELHYRHHKCLGTEDDPELHHKTARAPQWDLPSTPMRVLKYVALDLVGYSIPDFLIIVTYSKPAKKTEYIPLALFHISMNTALFLTGFWWVSIFWYLCLMTTFMLFFRLRLWVEHQGTDFAHRLQLPKWLGALIAPHNSWYHWEHHMYPAVPYHQLPKIRALLPEEPVITFPELIQYYLRCSKIKSGKALKKN